MNEIFLNYRRSDDPGYVGRLADSLERVFEKDTVYRDLDNERASGNWPPSGGLFNMKCLAPGLGFLRQPLIETAYSVG